MMAVVIGDKSVLIDFKNREICFGFDCIRYRTKEQFDVAYEVVTMTAKICEELAKKIEKELRNASEEGRI